MSGEPQLNDVLAELQWRDLIFDSTDIEALNEALNAGPVVFYCGFDPTAPSLHHGHLMQLVTMRHLQNAGHHPIALVGGATGLIGDPRDKGERILNSKDVVAGWVERLRAQISSILKMDGANPAQVVNNLDWTNEISAIDFLRDLGKHFRLGNMLAKDSVARRLNSEEGISFTEFSYQILQANDFLELFKRYNCVLETGGQDQWGNIVGGVDLVRKITGASVHALTTKLLTKADGTKFGKTEGGAIWLDPQMLSPYKFYQFWLNVADEEVVTLLKRLTFITREQISQLEQALVDRPHAREAQKALAHEVTALVHGEALAVQIAEASAVVFGKGDVTAVDKSVLLDAVAQLPSIKFAENSEPDTEKTIRPLVEVLVALGLENGVSAARRTIKAGGISLNNVKVDDPDYQLSSADALPAGIALIRKGKKNLNVVYF